MNYKTGAAFRAALGSRLLNESRHTGVPLVRLRKSVAFDRLLARLVANPQHEWVLKGGFALQLRLEHAGGFRPRTTRAVDLHSNASRENVHRLLAEAARIDLHDWAQFDISVPTLPGHDEDALLHGALRSHVQMHVDGHLFEAFSVDIGLHDSLLMLPDILPLPPLLAFADIPTTCVPCHPLTQHIAEKIHAYARMYASGASTRVKDLIDLLLMAELDKALASNDLHYAIQHTFELQGAMPPSRLPDPPSSWQKPYRELARQVGLRETTLDEGLETARLFIDPVLMREAQGNWNNIHRRWML